MAELVVGLGERSYPICIEEGCLSKIGTDLSQRKIANRYCILADEKVASLYAKKVIQSLAGNNISAELITFPAGEASKNLLLFSSLSSLIAQKGYDRKDGIIALGGGVTGDLAGFIASSYMRGIPFVQIPTSLLAQVDSSVGGKTGVDIPEGKNLVGAFYQPKIVYIDTEVLRTLPRSEFIGGMAEVIKYGVIKDPGFFNYLIQVREDVFSLNPEVMTKIIHTCCSIKAAIVAEDEQEINIRRILNYGHTIGHAVESVSEFAIIHGKAVAIGMVAAARLSVLKNLMSEAEASKIISGIADYELPTEIPVEFDRAKIKKYLLADKKIEAGKVFYILPQSIGKVVITDDVADSLVDKVLASE